MKKIFLFAFFLYCYLNLSSQNDELHSLMKDRNEFYFSFQCDDLYKLAEISDIVSIDKVDGNKVEAYADNDGYERFLALGYETTLLTPPSMLETHAMYHGEMRDEYEWNEYPTYEAYESMMLEYAGNYPDRCSLIELGVLESGRKILIMRLNNGPSEAKPKVLLTSTIHGDETVGFVMMLRLIDELLTMEGRPEVDNVVNNIDLFVCPNSNPDGTYHAGNHTVNGASRFNALGIDMNRNFPDYIDGPHPDGKDYASETEMFMRLADEYQFTMSANYHGGAEVVNYPWDNNSTLHADDDWWQMISRQYADLAHEKNPDYMTDRDDGITNGSDWYVINGSRQDYMNYYKQCREVTIECSKTKCPPAADLPLYWEYNRNSIYTFLNQALCGVYGTVKDADTQQALKAVVKVLDHDQNYSVVESQLPEGVFYRPIKAGIYTLEITAEGYVAEQKNIVVNDNERLMLDVQLSKCSDSFDDNVLDDVEIVMNHSEDMISVKTAGSSQKIKWELISLQGQAIEKSGEMSGDTELKIHELSAGIYFFNLIVGDKQKGKKIVIR